MFRIFEKIGEPQCACERELVEVFMNVKRLLHTYSIRKCATFKMLTSKFDDEFVLAAIPLEYCVSETTFDVLR